MYIPDDYKLSKLATAIENVDNIFNDMLDNDNYSVEEDCKLAGNLIIARDKLLTTLTYFNIRKRIV